jgi:acyl carrier protein
MPSNIPNPTSPPIVIKTQINTQQEFSIEIPDKDADSIHSVDKAVEYIVNQPDAN